jgi:hypothetical protein
MNVSILSQIEKSVRQLSWDEQLWLIERLTHLLRESISKEPDTFARQLVAMASDREIQDELQQINQEFVLTEADGLERV